jgi:peptidyl-prolyl cis-trans isomerase SurA
MDRRLYILKKLFKLHELLLANQRSEATMMNIRALNISFIIFLFLTFCFALLPRNGSAQGVMRIAAVVNDDVISALDLGQRIRLTIAMSRMQDSPEVRQRLAPSLLRTMIDERLKTQEAKRLEIEISDEEVQNGVNSYAQSQKIPPEKFAEALAQIGVDIGVLKDQARAEIAWARVITSEGRERIKVSENEINAAIAAIEANKGKPEYLYSEIFLPVETPDQENNVREMAERLVEHIQNGSPFEALARDFSQSTSAVRGGNLDWVQSGNIPKKLETAVSQLQINGYSAPIRTISGYYLLHLRDKRISGQEEQDEVLSVSQAIFPLEQNASQDVLDARKGAARTLSYQAQTCDQFDELAKQLGSPNSGRINKLNLSKMPPELRIAISPLGKGQTTISQQSGALLVIMVCSREKEAPIPDVAKRKAIQENLRFERIGREDRRLLQKLRRAAFVDVRL